MLASGVSGWCGGRGATPGVAGWYSLNGRPTGVWGLNAGAAPPSGRAYVVLNLADLVNHIGTDRIEAAASVLDRIPSFAGKIVEARADDWHKYPSLYLADVATNPVHVETLVEGIRMLTDPMASATGGAP
ncbi:hypothetical protein [Cellulomonas sp. P24]|uniref:hypothetical protein n=1 Tax=Cellulomonas sp. P24 TaxID=2885206 RepID=UPI00216B516A|nr:hypothetical protein [Cellulomonas sp. P24]MCR6494045.1 hypothetical protein [Cellulomonas sp. P24]